MKREAEQKPNLHEVMCGGHPSEGVKPWFCSTFSKSGFSKSGFSNVIIYGDEFERRI
jgi:hypothetical protein